MGVTVAVLLLSGCAAPAVVGPTSTPASEPSASPEPSATTAPGGTSAPAAPAPPGVPVEGVAPVAVSAPSIGLSAGLIDLGIAADGRMEVPADADDVGWFTGGGRPGGRGPTVIAAHVDSATGPAVFARLDELVPGDEVDVSTADGGVVRYVVSEVADFAKADFPTARVFGAQPADQLRLITCGGVFDSAVGHYDDNRVVFAEPAA